MTLDYDLFNSVNYELFKNCYFSFNIIHLIILYKFLLELLIYGADLQNPITSNQPPSGEM